MEPFEGRLWTEDEQSLGSVRGKIRITPAADPPCRGIAAGSDPDPG